MAGGYGSGMKPKGRKRKILTSPSRRGPGKRYHDTAEEAKAPARKARRPGKEETGGGGRKITQPGREETGAVKKPKSRPGREVTGAVKSRGGGSYAGAVAEESKAPKKSYGKGTGKTPSKTAGRPRGGGGATGKLARDIAMVKRSNGGRTTAAEKAAMIRSMRRKQAKKANQQREG